MCELTQEERILTEKVRKMCKIQPQALYKVEKYEPGTLIDGCRYLVYSTDDYKDVMDHSRGASWPCRSLKECVYFVDNSYYYEAQ